MSNPETPEKSILNVGARLPEASDVKGFFSKLFTRFKSAKEASEKGSNWKEKVLFFISALFSEVQELSEEEQKIQDETATKAGEVLMQMPDEQLATVVEKELTGRYKGPIEPVVHDFSMVSVSTGKSLGKEKIGKVSKALDKVKAGEGQAEALRPEEKALLMAFGLKTVGALKTNPAYDTVEKFTAALDKFDTATRNGKGLQYLKQPKIRELFKFNMGDVGVLDKFRQLLPDISFDKKVWGMELSIGSGKLKSSELQRKLAGASLSYEEAVKLQGSFTPLFPNTKDEDRAKALMTINQIILNDKGFPTNQHLAELVFSIHTKDIEKLSEILQS